MRHEENYCIWSSSSIGGCPLEEASEQERIHKTTRPKTEYKRTTRDIQEQYAKSPLLPSKPLR
jgi:hypothetical protein